MNKSMATYALRAFVDPTTRIAQFDPTTRLEGYTAGLLVTGDQLNATLIEFNEQHAKVQAYVEEYLGYEEAYCAAQTQSLQDQIQDLLAQIATLQGQVGSGASGLVGGIHNTLIFNVEIGALEDWLLEEDDPE